MREFWSKLKKWQKIVLVLVILIAFGGILDLVGYESKPPKVVEKTPTPTVETTPEPAEPEPMLSDNDAYVTAQNILKQAWADAEFESYLLSDDFAVSSSVFDGFERYKVEGTITLNDEDHEFVVTFELNHDTPDEVQTDLVEIDKETIYDRYAE